MIADSEAEPRTETKIPTETGTRRRSRLSSIVHVSFEVGILIKAIHAVVEIGSGVLMIFLKPGVIAGWIASAISRLSGSGLPGMLGTLLQRLGESYSVHAQRFGIIYFFSHGVINGALAALLWARKLWAYPLLIVVLAAFIGYQFIRFFSTHSGFLLFLSAYDGIFVYLTSAEYRRIKEEFAARA